jgi:hypothetical protein
MLSSPHTSSAIEPMLAPHALPFTKQLVSLPQMLKAGAPVFIGRRCIWGIDG